MSFSGNGEVYQIDSGRLNLQIVFMQSACQITVNNVRDDATGNISNIELDNMTLVQQELNSGRTGSWIWIESKTSWTSSTSSTPTMLPVMLISHRCIVSAVTCVFKHETHIWFQCKWVQVHCFQSPLAGVWSEGRTHDTGSWKRGSDLV